MRIHFKKILVFFFFIASFFLAADVVLALNEADLGTQYGEQIGLAAQDPRVTAANIIRLILGFLGIIAVALVMYAGWLWMTAAGEEQKIEQAKKILKNGLIGLLIILAAYGIVSFIISRLLDATGGGKDNGGGGGGGGPMPASSANSFYMNNTVPRRESINVVRNVTVKTFYNKPIDSNTSQAILNNNFKVEDLGGVDHATGQLVVKNYPPKIIFSEALAVITDIKGAVGTSSLWREINFVASSTADGSDCGDERHTKHCFPEWHRIKVTVDANSGIRNTDGLALTCTGNYCEFEFSTGDRIDSGPPTAGITAAKICQDDGQLLSGANKVTGWGRDDIGLSGINFYAKKDGEDAVLAHALAGNNEKYQFASTAYNTASYRAGDYYTFIIEAKDLADETATSGFRTAIKSGHCCNGEKDEASGETGVDCGGTCGACDGAACAADMDALGACNNNLCASSNCTNVGSDKDKCVAAGYAAGTTECCLCQTKPVIYGITPSGGFCSASYDQPCNKDVDCGAGGTCNRTAPNSAEGNFLTITGKNFGAPNTELTNKLTSANVDNTHASTNLVSFVGLPGVAADDKIANPPSIINPLCITNWTDSQITVVVPAGAASGSIQVVSENGQSDSTNDDYGPPIEDFIANAIDRPGLCLVNSANGHMDTAIHLSGVKLSQGQAFFGDYDDGKIAAASPNVRNDQLIDAAVPNIAPGKTSVFVLRQNGSIDIASNYLDFTKDEEPYLGPAIAAFYPTAGNAGQYITINGSGFGNKQGANKVYFGPVAGGHEANYEFPAVCAETIWSDKQVIVKVPAIGASGLADNTGYHLTMIIGGATIDTSKLVEAGEVKKQFTASSTIALKPSLCAVSPLKGAKAGEVSLWGEYFGVNDANSKVRFSVNKDKTGQAGEGNEIKSWGPDNSVTAGIKPDKAVTTVPFETVSGPVKIVKGSPEAAGNSLNFEIGQCNADAECGSNNVCCPESSSFAKFCKEKKLGDNYGNCYETVKASVYEWDFTTGTSNHGINDPCYATSLVSDLTCDASRSECNAGLVCDTAFCLCKKPCNGSDTPAECQADQNQCAGTETPICNEETCLCEEEECRTSRDCAQGEICNASSVCVPATCSGYGLNQCVAGLYCPNSPGQCSVDSSAATPASCDPATKQCEQPGAGICECCCNINENTSVGNSGCCAPLTCGGTCGVDASSTGPITIAGVDYNLGQCTGCAAVGNTQAEHNAACNCSSTYGRFCDTSKPSGVCVDCNSLTDALSCTTAGAGACCFDAITNTCQGVGERSTTTDNGSTYCAYYSCDGGSCGSASTTGTYFTNTCDNECSAGGGAGLTCDDRSATSTANQCDTSFCSLSCLNEDGSGASSALNDTCGTCCCDPNKVGSDSFNPATYDKCKGLSENPNSNLACKANQGVCSGAGRGLCCGCAADSDCGGGALAGCSTDTCCRARPAVSELLPADNAENVCRNVLISATFDQAMDVKSLSGNILVLGDYVAEECPEGTQYLFADSAGPKQYGFLEKLFRRISGSFGRLFAFVFKQEVFAYTPDTGHNYCAVAGTVGVYNNANATTVTFSPMKALDLARRYFVIIRGDKDPADSVKEGVLSADGVSLNANVAAFQATFNGKAYTNSKIWSFKTKSKTANDEGVCLLEKIEIEPVGYLFQTAKDNRHVGGLAPGSCTDDNNIDSCYDKLNDNDKVFAATALAAGGQPIAPIADVYDWTWEWTINDMAVAAFKSGDPEAGSRRTIVAQNRQDAKTAAVAKATIKSDTINNPPTAGQAKSGQANIYVFLCENPWPPIKPDGTWSPWKDSVEGGGSVSFQANYDIYYCRDSGSDGSADDLPAIQSNRAVTPMINEKVLKETYFFRENLPDVSAINLATTSAGTAAGGRAALYWNNITAASGETLDKYIVHYGTQAGYLNKLFSVSSTTNHTSASPVIIDKLANDIVYYFAVTAKYQSGAESKYSNTVQAVPKDTVGPAAPAFSLVAAASSISVVWTDQSAGDAKSFKIFYGLTSNYGDSLAAPAAANGTTIISGLSSGQTYHFNMKAYDSYGNVSSAAGDQTKNPL